MQRDEPGGFQRDQRGRLTMPDSAVVRIPLTITATGSGQKTDGVLVAVAVTQLDALEAENERLRRGLRQVADGDYPADGGDAEEWAREILDRPESVDWEIDSPWDGTSSARRPDRSGRAPGTGRDPAVAGDERAAVPGGRAEGRPT